MVEKRRFPRHKCVIKTKFNYYEGDPDEINFDISVPLKGKGTICDISQGGLLIVSKVRVAVGMPALINFKTKKKKNSVYGRIIRTGILANNPSEVAQKLASCEKYGDSYIAIEFKEPIELDASEL